MNKKGFTLIELLAVITIMGILMLVAIPAVSRTLENVRNEDAKNNTRVFVREANRELLDLSRHSAGVPNGTYGIMSDGNICLEADITNPDDCNTYKIFEVPLESGQHVSGGLVQVEDNKIVNFYNIKVINRFVNIRGKDDYYVTTAAIEIVQKLCRAVDGSVSLDLGTAYNCEVKDGTTNKFYVLKVSGDTVSLIMDRNIIQDVEWHHQTSGIYTINFNGCGPTKAYETLYNLTSDWNKIPNIVMNYTDPNTPDIRFMTREEDFRLYSRNPDCDDFDRTYTNLKARMPYQSEFSGNPTYLFDNLSSEEDYWGNESITYMGTYAAVTLKGGDEVLGQRTVGIRPVIEVNKNDLG